VRDEAAVDRQRDAEDEAGAGAAQPEHGLGEPLCILPSHTRAVTPVSFIGLGFFFNAFYAALVRGEVLPHCSTGI